jgi:hypothetical protein
MTENIHQRPILISKREGGIFSQKRKQGEHSGPQVHLSSAESLRGAHELPITSHKSRFLRGEEKSNRNNPTFKNRRNLLTTNEKAFSNRDKNTSFALPHFRPWRAEAFGEGGLRTFRWPKLGRSSSCTETEQRLMMALLISLNPTHYQVGTTKWARRSPAAPGHGEVT